MSLRDEAACAVFGINFSSVDLFKEDFFQHGVFYFKNLTKKITPEYAAIIQFFKMSKSDRFY